MGSVSSRALGYDNCARIKAIVRRSTFGPFRQFLGDARCEIIQRLRVVLHGILGSFVRDALREGSVDPIACLPAPCLPGL
jgi:hypothetical protein